MEIVRVIETEVGKINILKSDRDVTPQEASLYKDDFHSLLARLLVNQHKRDADKINKAEAI